MSLTVEELRDKRISISQCSEDDLNGFTVKRLRELSAGIVPSCSRMKKQELIEALLTLTQPERALIVIEATKPEVIGQIKKEALEKNNKDGELGLFCERFYKEFRQIIINCWDVEQQEFKLSYGMNLATLAYKIKAWINSKPGRTGLGMAAESKMRYRTHIVKFIEGGIESNDHGTPQYKPLKSALKDLNNQLKTLFSDESEQKKLNSRFSLTERKHDKEKIDIEAIHKWSLSILENLDNLKKRDWKAVSFSLAFMCGRRMAEIHLEKTNFEIVDNYHINFTGQLKAKGGAEKYFVEFPSYVIPVLCDSRLILKADNWLRKFDKKVDTSERADIRYSKDLNTFVKLVKNELRIEHRRFTYKASRSIYAGICSETFKQEQDNELYLAQILGHGRADIMLFDKFKQTSKRQFQYSEDRQINKVADTATPQSYKSDFIVSNWEFLKDIIPVELRY